PRLIDGGHARIRRDPEIRHRRDAGAHAVEAGRSELLRTAEGDRRSRGGDRSEEHTSELQSLRHLVCRLLLEKKKKKKKYMILHLSLLLLFFYFLYAALSELYTLSLHDALPICPD